MKKTLVFCVACTFCMLLIGCTKTVDEELQYTEDSNNEIDSDEELIFDIGEDENEEIVEDDVTEDSEDNTATKDDLKNNIDNLETLNDALEKNISSIKEISNEQDTVDTMQF